MSRTRRSTGAPCNICGFFWPFHAEVCAYKVTAKENVELKKEKEELEADLTTVGIAFMDLLEYTKELEHRLGISAL